MDKFDRIKESFIHYNSVGNGAVLLNIFQGSKKRIWLGSAEGFCLFEAKKGEFKFYKKNDKDTNSLSQNYVNGITEDNIGELWIGSRSGLNRFDPETGKFVSYYHDPANNKSIGSGYIKTVYKER